MKKNIIFIMTLLSIIFLTACCKTKAYEIALVTDVGNIDDKSFNEGAWNGVKEFAKEKSITYNYYRPSEDSLDSRVETIKTAIDKGAILVVCPGYLFEDVIYKVQDDYKDVSFLLLDGEPHSTDFSNYKTGPNVHCIKYQEEQAGFLAGYAAVKEGYKKLGFMGGIKMPAVTRFGNGYLQGIEYAAKELELTNLLVNFTYTGSFVASDDIKSKADGWYASGIEVIFACGGAIHLSITQAAKQANKYVIGVDSDQASESPTIITSAMKDLTQSVKLALTDFYQNNKKWTDNQAGKLKTLGAKENAIGLPTAKDSWRFKKFTKEEYQNVFKKIVDGEIKISNSLEELKFEIIKVDYNA